MNDLSTIRELDAALAFMTKVAQQSGQSTRGMGALAALSLIAARAQCERHDPADWYKLQQMVREEADDSSRQIHEAILRPLSQLVPTDYAVRLVSLILATGRMTLRAWVDHLGSLCVGTTPQAQGLFAQWIDKAVATASDDAADLGPLHTPANVVHTIVDLVWEPSAATILDPACGTGAFLASAFSRTQTGDDHSRPHLVGVEINADLAAVATLRLCLMGAFDPPVISGARPPGSGDKFDLILSSPPFGRNMSKAELDALNLQDAFRDLSKLSAESAFVAYAADRLTPKGRGALLIPPGFLYREDDGKVRRELASRHQVAGVVMLPKGVLAPATKLAPAVILLRGRAANADQKTVFVDATQLGRKERRRHVLDDGDRAAIAETVKTGRPASDQIKVTLVDDRRLRDERYDLRPETYLREQAEPVQRRPLAERMAEVADLATRYADLARTTDDLIRRLSGPGAV
jgi:type I restriction-modification system DNA methylase subunit